MNCLFGLIVVAALADSGGPALVVDAPPRTATLSAIDGTGVILDDGQQRNVPWADLVRWGTPPKTPSQALAVLSDGTLLMGEITHLDRQTAHVETDRLGTVQLPRAALAGAILHAPAEQQRLDRLLERIRTPPETGDRLLLANGDALDGRLERITPETVELRTDAGATRIEPGRLSAMILAERRPGVPLATKLQVWLGVQDGSRLLVDRFETDTAGLRAVLAAGPAVRVQLADVVWLQPRGGRAVYLSDLSAAGYRHVPYLTLTWPFHSDRSASGAPLRAGGQEYAKGLGMHSAARLTYLLTGPYRRFEAELAIDQETAGGGSVRFRVFVDGRQRAESVTIRGGDRPVSIAVEVSGVKRLDLVVDFADRADQLDHADWLDARLIR
jgi:hypothetical protein